LKRLRQGIGGILLLFAIIMCNGARPFAIYALAAFLHELGHIIAAKMQKIKLKEIKFGILGVRIETGERMMSYKDELLIAIAGPATNLLTALIILAGAKISGYALTELFDGASELLHSGQSGALGYIGFFAVSSLAHAVTNLMPIKRLDGGRALYCTVAAISSERVAETALTLATALSLFAIWTIALYLMLRISSGIGIYAFAAFIFLSTLRGDK
jgi:Zn-dependent protease